MAGKRARTLLILTILVLFTVPTQGAYSLDSVVDRLYSSFWFEREPRPLEEYQDGPRSREDAVREMLTEARFVFSGMIYGFSFRYTPGDRKRDIEDLFELIPVAEISWGDSRVSVLETREENNTVYAKLVYRLDEHQAFRVGAWDANSFPSSAGTGEGVYFSRAEDKIEAHRQAVKEAIRGYFRTRTYSKPKEITGRVFLSEEPRSFYDAGICRSTVRIKIDPDEITGYSIH